MKRVTILSTLVLLTFAFTAIASAATATGTTTLLGTPVAGTSVDVDVSVVSETPVVAYEYAIQNECFFSGKASGPPDSYQRDDIVNWYYSTPAPYGTVPHAIVTVYLTTVPSGAACKVFIVKNNQVVKESTTTYTVE